MNEAAWRRLAKETEFPIKNVTGSILSVQTVDGSSIFLENAPNTFLTASVLSSYEEPLNMILPRDFQIEIMHNISLILEENRKTNMYLEEIVGDEF